MRRAFLGTLLVLVGLVGFACTTRAPVPSADSAPAPAVTPVVEQAQLTPALDSTAPVVAAGRLPSARLPQRVVTARATASAALAVSALPSPAPTQRPAIAARETPAPIVTEVPTPQPTPDLGAIGSSADSFDPSGLSAAGNAGFEVLDDPLMIAARDATWLRADDVILGVVHPSGEAHAFPVRQMAYHHIANIAIAGDPYLVTY